MNSVEFTDNLNKMNMNDFKEVLAKYEVAPFDNPAENEYFAKYLLNGERNGLVGIKNVAKARELTTKLFVDMPHLKVKYNDPLKAALTMSKPIKAPKVAKVTGDKAPKVAKTAKVKWPDFAIVYRADRGGYEGWYAGKAEAFRPTVEKVQAFFMKKYQQEGYTV